MDISFNELEKIHESKRYREEVNSESIPMMPNPLKYETISSSCAYTLTVIPRVLTREYEAPIQRVFL